MYLKQNLRISNNLTEFLKIEERVSYHKLNHNYIEFEKIIDKQVGLVVGEPGYGKSRLLKEVTKKAIIKNHSCFYCDLKKVKSGLESYMKSCLFKEEPKLNIFESPYYYTPNFELENQSNILICLDALDEVSENLVPTTIKAIETFVASFPKVKLLVSSRTHHVIRNIDLLKNIRFEVIEILALDGFKIVKYLKHYCSELQIIDDLALLKKLETASLHTFYKSNGILSTPRYLELFVELAIAEGFDTVIKYTRSQLFEAFITKRLKEEDHKKQAIQQGFRTQIPYIRRVLEQLALILEIQRVNTITKEDFTTVILDLNLGLHVQMPLTIFWDGTILKDTGDILEFDNTEFQEYLAAKALLRLGRAEQIIFDIALEQKLKDIYPNWMDVLSYVTEQETVLLLPLIQFGIRNHREHLFQLIHFFDKSYFIRNEGFKSKIFELIFEYYTNKQDGFKSNLEVGLVHYFIPNKHKILLERLVKKEGSRETLFLYKLNVCLLLRELFKTKELFSNEEILGWKKELMAYVFLPTLVDNADAMQHYAVIALGEICETVDELCGLAFPFGNCTNIISDAIIRIHKQIDANHPRSIRLFLKNIPRKRFSDSSPFNEINTTKGFINFLQIVLINGILNKGNNLKTITTYNQKLQEPFFENLRKNWNNEIKELVIQVLIFGRRRIFFDRNKLYNTFIKILNEKHKNALFEVFNTIIRDKTLKLHLFDELLGTLIRFEQVKEFKQLVDNEAENGNLFLGVLISSNDKNIRNLQQVYYPNREKEINERQLKIKNKREERIRDQFKYKESIYNQFIKNLNNESFIAICNYKDNIKSFSKKISKSRKLKLKKLIIRLFQEMPLSIQKRNTHIEKIILYAGIYLVQDFSINITSYRKQLIHLIPYNYGVEKILELLGNLNTDEINYFIKLYQDNQLSSVHIFIKCCEDWNIKTASNVLKSFITNSQISYDDKIAALDLVIKWGSDISYLKKIFKFFSKEQEEENGSNYRILKIINRNLLKHDDEESVIWLIEQLTKHKYKTKRDPNTNSIIFGVPDRPSDGLSNNLSIISHPKFVKDMIRLLKISFNILEEHDDYYEYVTRLIWGNIEKYFIQLKDKTDLIKENLDLLNAAIGQPPYSNPQRGFKYKLDQIHQTYLKQLSTPSKISNCIKTFKSIKNKQYLDIITPKDLFDLVIDILKTDFRYWVEKEGGYKLFTTVNSKVRETFMQKVCVPILENSLLKKGIRTSDIVPVDFKLYREIQTPKDNRVDLLITYGSIGTILLELKREYNKDLNPAQRVAYRTDKMLPYMKATYADYGILLIFKDDPNYNKTKPLGQYISEIAEVYKMDRNIEVIGINCIN